MPKLRCSVDSCKFWEKENRCAADEVEVRNDYEVPNMEIGEIAGSADAQNSAQTCCQTYKPSDAKKQ